MPENGRKDDLFVPDFVKEAEEQTSSAKAWRNLSSPKMAGSS